MQWTYIINALKGGETVRTFCEKELQKTDKKEFRIEKVIKRKDNKLYVTWKGYNNSFNSWIHRKDIVWMRQYFPKPKVNNVSTTDTSNLV